MFVLGKILICAVMPVWWAGKERASQKTKMKKMNKHGVVRSAHTHITSSRSLPLKRHTFRMRLRCSLATQVELSLVRVIERRSVNHQLQDSRCKRTGSIVTRTMATHSESAAELQCEQSPEEMQVQYHAQYVGCRSQFIYAGFA